jgi:hypothetical protein
MKKITKEIDYYGDKDNYIHLKFGHCRKMYNFTREFIAEYPDFAREYQNYFEGKESKFTSPFQVVRYVFDKAIPVSFYYNFSDEPAGDKAEIMEYLVNENSFIGDLTKK